jgi:uncharacterized membrane protein YhaH (DUF805 family)
VRTALRGDRIASILVGAILTLFLIRAAPLSSNRDDHIRYYFGGWVGTAVLRGGATAKAVGFELEQAAAAIRDPYLASRFAVAQVPYSLTAMLGAGVAESLRPDGRPPTVVRWILVTQTLFWLCLLLTAALVARRLPEAPLGWTVVVVLVLAWLHAHTSPLFPVPRAAACLFTGLALALLLTGAGERTATACLALAAASHPLNQAVNLTAAGAFVLVVAGTAAAPGLRRASAIRAGALGIACVGLVGLLLSRANPQPGLDLGVVLGARPLDDMAAAWEVNRIAVRRTAVLVGLPLLALAWRYVGTSRTVVLGLLVLSSLAAAGLLSSGPYRGEFTQRVAGAWVAVLLALCLRRDLRPSPPGPLWSRRGLTAAALGLLCLPAAIPEALGGPSVPFPRPGANRPPLSEVEVQCVRILGTIRRAGRHERAAPFTPTTEPQRSE